MTIREVSNMIYSTTTNGIVNGEKFTKQELEHVVRMWMRYPEQNKIPGRHVIELLLPDGRWICTIDKYADTEDGYDLTIPDTREQESKIIAALMA